MRSAKSLSTTALKRISVRYFGGKLFLGAISPESLPALAKALARAKLPIGDANA